MKYIIDHDFHIHSNLSLCCKDERQTVEFILQAAGKNGFDKVCVTNHFWDEKIPVVNEYYEAQKFEHICKVLPFPKHRDVKLFFGCETEMDKLLRLGITRETIDKFDFVVVPTTHLHMKDFTISHEDNALEKRAQRYVERFEAFLKMDLPFYKMGIAHLTCRHIASENPSDHIRVIDLVSDEVFTRLFACAARKGLGIELNFNPFQYNQDEYARILRPYRLAQKCGCTFYFGSDAHHPEEAINARERFEKIAESLELQEKDKFSFLRRSTCE